MRRVLLLGALCAVVGCTYYIEPERNDVAAAARDESCPTTAAGAEDIDANANADADAPPPAYAPKSTGTFELVARAVLHSIPYKDCGAGGRGDVDVTFQPNGAVQKVVVYADAWQDTAKQCVAERFAFARVAPFAGDARTVRWHVELSDGGWG